MFGLAVAYDLVNDPDVKSTAGVLAAHIAGYVSGHTWTPNGDIGNTFLDRPEELQNLSRRDSPC